MASTVKLDTKALQSLIKRVGQINGTEVEVGFFEGSNYGSENGNLPVAMVAFLNEYGRSLGPQGVPARPFMHDTFEGSMNQFHMARSMQKIFELTLQNGRGTQRLLKSLGTMVKEIMQTTIDNYPGHNSPTTIARKGFDDPLYDTGKMLRSVKFQIHKGR